MVEVSSEVAVFTASTEEQAERTLLVVHGGPDWDHSYLREPLSQLAGSHRVVMPDLRGCGRSTSGLPDEWYTPDAEVSDLLALVDELGMRQVADHQPADPFGPRGPRRTSGDGSHQISARDVAG